MIRSKAELSLCKDELDNLAESIANEPRRFKTPPPRSVKESFVAKFAAHYGALKLAIARALGLFRSNAGLRREVERLQGDTEDLHARLVAAQQAKGAAQNQADELRKEKERLRVKVSDLKKEADHLQKVIQQSNEKISALRDENASLKTSLDASRAKRRH